MRVDTQHIKTRVEVPANLTKKCRVYCVVCLKRLFVGTEINNNNDNDYNNNYSIIISGRNLEIAAKEHGMKQ